MEQQQNFFAKNKKTILIVGGVIFVGTLIYLLTRKKQESTNYTNTNNNSSSENTDEASQIVSESINESYEQKTDVIDATLPNGGVDCSDVKSKFDRDYDYVKCKGIWYTKSKTNPASKFAKDRYKDWTSLESNPVATERLNRRYP